MKQKLPPVRLKDWARNGDFRLTRTFPGGITFTVYPDQKRPGRWAYSGGRHSHGGYHSEAKAVAAAEVFHWSRSRYNTPGLSMTKIRRHAKRMTRKPTRSEALLWGVMQSDLPGCFTFQHRLLGRIADFYASHLLLVVEVDGPYHSGQQKRRDALRDKYFACHGVKTVRVTSEAVESDVHGVWQFVRSEMKKRDPALLPPSPGARYIPHREARKEPKSQPRGGEPRVPIG